VKIKMLEDAPGSPDGIHVQDYENGVEYDVPDRLGEVFVQYGHAAPADAPAAKPKSKRAVKDAGAAPENKGE
jgi:hypothetical protein